MPPQRRRSEANPDGLSSELCHTEYGNKCVVCSQVCGCGRISTGNEGGGKKKSETPTAIDSEQVSHAHARAWNGEGQHHGAGALWASTVVLARCGAQLARLGSQTVTRHGARVWRCVRGARQVREVLEDAKLLLRSGSDTHDCASIVAWIETGAERASVSVRAHVQCRKALEKTAQRASVAAAGAIGAGASPAAARLPSRQSARQCAIKHDKELCVFCQQEKATEHELAVSTQDRSATVWGYAVHDQALHVRLLGAGPEGCSLSSCGPGVGSAKPPSGALRHKACMDAAHTRQRALDRRLARAPPPSKDDAGQVMVWVGDRMLGSARASSSALPAKRGRTAARCTHSQVRRPPSLPPWAGPAPRGCQSSSSAAHAVTPCCARWWGASPRSCPPRPSPRWCWRRTPT